MKRAVWALLVAALVAVPALAVTKGGTLYIKTKDAALLEKADAKSKKLAPLKPGEAVTWNGAAPEDKRFHAVETARKKAGYVLQANLSPSKPQEEVLLSKGGKAVDSKSFASSGAATKALTESGLKYAQRKAETNAEQKARMERASKALITAESVAVGVTAKDAFEYGCKSTGAR